MKPPQAQLQQIINNGMAAKMAASQLLFGVYSGPQIPLQDIQELNELAADLVSKCMVIRDRLEDKSKNT